jgi:hypothetical protein
LDAVHKILDQHPLATAWIVNLSMLLIIERYDGFRWAWLSPMLYPLDQMRGILSWETYFKLTLLRLISYAMDR